MKMRRKPPASGVGLRCAVDNCPDRVWVVKHRLCSTHYQRFIETKRFATLEASRPCAYCTTPMELAGAHVITKRFCSDKCYGAAKRQRERETETPDIRQKRVSYRYAWKLKQYGLTPETFAQLVQRQNGCCGICLAPEEDCKGGLVVDHDHSTGIARGLLCRVCNAGLGALDDSVERLNAAITYLKESIRAKQPQAV